MFLPMVKIPKKYLTIHHNSFIITGMTKNEKANKQNMHMAVINEKIKAPSVKLILESGEQLGVVSTNEALTRARNEGLDLVLINAQNNPPVAKILNYSKFKYSQAKKQRRQQRIQKLLKQEIKELRLRPVTDQHDIDIRIKQAKKFIDDGDKVLFVVRFRDREANQRDRGVELLNFIAKNITNAVVEKPITYKGNAVTMLLAPDKKTLEKFREQTVGKLKNSV